MIPLALDDLVVVGVEQALAAPLATRQLADLGARVIKVEHPDGGDFARGYDATVEGISSAFVWLNRGKESVQLDLKTDSGLASLHAILGRADVLVANLSPRVLGDIGLTADELARHYPQLVTCTISGYAPEGPWAERKAYDALIQAETGLTALTGTADAPAKAGISVADIAAGSVAFAGVLAAIRHRDRTGEALPVHVSLFAALTEWMAYPLYYTAYGGTAPAPMGTAHPTIAPYGVVRCADGERLMIAVQNEREWQRLCGEVLLAPELLADAQFASNARRVANRAQLDEQLAAAFGKYPADVVISRIESARIAWSRLNGVGDLAAHSELASESRWQATPTPSGTVRTLVPVGTPGGQSPRGRAVPDLGEHTEAVLAEFAGTAAPERI